MAVHISGINVTFKTIQAAIDQVHQNQNNPTWIKIHVDPGTYTEQVIIPYDKPFIFIQGSGEENTRVERPSFDNIDDATFISQANNIVVRDITFANTYNLPHGSTKNPMKRAVAVKVSGDKTSFYNVKFLGVQDTLYDASNRHYFKNCFIEGSVDFIFGYGRSFYENCTISVVPKVGVGAITAQGRSNTTDSSGFVFKDCRIVGTGRTILGRAWAKFARVLFFNTYMDDIIVEGGWSQWQVKNTEIILFGEYGCEGPGAKSHRVNWIHRIIDKTKVPVAKLEKFGNISYVNAEKWIEKQPSN